MDKNKDVIINGECRVNFREIGKKMLEAGEKIMEIYNTDFDVEYKDDKSPLTQADKISSDILCSYLKGSGYPIICEEIKNESYEKRKDNEIMWCVDPIDGTKEFIKKNGQFTTNVALICNGKPVFGAVGIPVENKVYIGGFGVGVYLMDDENDFKEIRREKWYERDINEITVVASSSHFDERTENFLNKLKEDFKVTLKNYGSSLKILNLALEKVDVYPRFAPTSEWDTAAAHAILQELGGELYNIETMKPLQYNKENLLNPYFIGFRNKFIENNLNKYL